MGKLKLHDDNAGQHPKAIADIEINVSNILHVGRTKIEEVFTIVFNYTKAYI